MWQILVSHHNAHLDAIPSLKQGMLRNNMRTYFLRVAPQVAPPWKRASNEATTFENCEGSQKIDRERARKRKGEEVNRITRCVLAHQICGFRIQHAAQPDATMEMVVRNVLWSRRVCGHRFGDIRIRLVVLNNRA